MVTWLYLQLSIYNKEQPITNLLNLSWYFPMLVSLVPQYWNLPSLVPAENLGLIKILTYILDGIQYLAKLIQHFSLKPFKNRKSDKQICLITTNQWLSSIFNQFSHLIQIVQHKMNKKKTSSDFRMTDIKFIYVNWNIL